MPTGFPAHKHRYLTLDGLRGVAAIAVMIYHRRSWSNSGHWFEHAHLAVDFFFLLSGFVLAHAYEHRLLSGMSVREFLRLRLIRLYPLIVLGTLLGAGYFLTSAASVHDRQLLTNIVFTLPLALLVLPAPQSLGSEPFPINPPAWSLFNELLVNFGYALIVRLLNTFTLLLIIGLSLVAEVASALHYGSLGPVGNQFGTLLAAVPRTALPFFLGVLLHRLHARARLPTQGFGIAVLSPVLLASFIPSFLHHSQPLYDIACVSLLYPAIILFGCRSQPAGRTVLAATALAELSFPVYVLHFPLFYWFSFFATAAGFTDGKPAPWYLLLAVVMIIGVSFALLRIYDIPLRRCLAKPHGSRTVQANNTDESALVGE